MSERSSRPRLKPSPGSPTVSSVPDTRRFRHETRRRNLTVARVETLAPKMMRVVLRGEELEGFTSLGFDDHVKLFFSGDEDSRADSPAAVRDFTPRWYDAEAGELWIDFFLHEAGPAASWALRVAVGQSLTVGGPRGSFVISTDGIDSHVLIGDETALPAMSRRLAELPAGTSALAVIETDEGSEGYPLESRAAHCRSYVGRGARRRMFRQVSSSTLCAVCSFPRDGVSCGLPPNRRSHVRSVDISPVSAVSNNIG